MYLFDKTPPFQKCDHVPDEIDFFLVFVVSGWSMSPDEAQEEYEEVKEEIKKKEEEVRNIFPFTVP